MVKGKKLKPLHATMSYAEIVQFYENLLMTIPLSLGVSRLCIVLCHVVSNIPEHIVVCFSVS